MRKLRASVLAAISAVPLAISGVNAQDLKLPPYVVFATLSGGGLLGAIGSGIGKLISDKTPMDVRMQMISAGSMDPLVNAGQVQFATGVSVEAYHSSRGVEHHIGRPQKGLRLVVGGPVLVTGFIVKKDSPVRTVADLKGRTVLGEFPGTRPIHFDGVATLATAGLTWKDVKVVPAADLLQSVQLFTQGRAEVGIGALGAGYMQDMDQNVGGIRYVGLPDGPDVAKRMHDAIPGYFPVSLKAGSGVGILDDIRVAAKDIYINASTKTDANAVYVLTKTLWNDIGELHGVHPIFRGWTHERMLNTSVTIPYHDGAIKFFKEIGVWTPEVEAHHQKLLQELGG